MAELNPFRALRCTNRTGIPNQAAELLRGWTEDGTLKQDTDPGFMIYEQEFSYLGQKKRVKGFLSLVKIEGDSIILPHEETDPMQVEETLSLMKETGSQLEPVYCMYQDGERKTMSRIHLLSSGKPRFEFQENGATHRIWVVNDILVIAAIKEDFAARRLFLADGHSRYEAARKWKENGGSDFVLAFLADMEQDITLLPAHCLINNLETWDETKFLADCEPYFQVIPRGTVDEIPANLDALYRQGKKAFAFYSGGVSWTLLILKDITVMAEIMPGKGEAFRQLDTSILHSLILKKLLGIPSMAIKATFVDSISQALASVQDGRAQAAFMLNPARLKEICEISEMGEKMPSRSTMFYPTVPVGVSMYRL